MIQKEVVRGINKLVNTCGGVIPYEKVVIVVDNSTKNIGDLIFQNLKKITNNVLLFINNTVVTHGAEPEDNIAHSMLNANVIFGLTRYSMAHTKARIKATNNGARYLSLPDYSFDQLVSSALDVDFFELEFNAKKLKDILDKGKSVQINTDKGTNLSLNINDRIANACPGFCNKKFILASPPNAETNIAPIEYSSKGHLVVDGSIPYPGLGKINESIKINIDAGVIKEIQTNCNQSILLKEIFKSLNNPKTKVLAEFGIGLNPKARLCGRMLEDEGCYNTIHFGFGSNATIGGKNFINFHIDFVVKKASVFIDDKLIIKKGEFLF